MLTAVASMPLSVTVPVVAPVARFTIRSAVPVASEAGARGICADLIVALKAAMFCTVTATAEEVAVPFALSVAFAVIVWLPLATVVLSQLTVYGEAILVPTTVPSTMKSTRAMVSM